MNQEQANKILDELHEDSHRACMSEGPCTCKGCFTSKGITKEQYANYLQMKGEILPITTIIDGQAVYIINEDGKFIGIQANP